ncbi:MAG: DUF1007 family protein [Chitinivibrionales bacterium]
MQIRSYRGFSLSCTHLLLLFLFTGGIQKASAHPHMWIDVQAKFMLTDSSLSGFYLYWTFDEMNSAMFTETYDANANGRFEPSEIRKLEDETLTRVAEGNYYTAFVWGNKFFKINSIEKFSATVLPDHRVQYSFFIPCDIPMENIADKEVSLFFEDPTMYIAFELQKKMIQVSSTDRWLGSISFGKIDYIDRIILSLKRARR